MKFEHTAAGTVKFGAEKESTRKDVSYGIASTKPGAIDHALLMINVVIKWDFYKSITAA